MVGGAVVAADVAPTLVVVTSAEVAVVATVDDETGAVSCPLDEQATNIKGPSIKVAARTCIKRFSLAIN